jgi:hypothetical protein
MIRNTLPMWVAAFVGCVASVNAAEGASESTDSMPAYRPFSLSAEAGTTGLGGTARWRFADHFGLRAGMDYFSYSDSREIEGITYDAKLRLQSEPLTVDLYPWKNHSFYLSLGVGLNQNRLTGTASTTQPIDIGNTTYPGGATLDLSVKQESVNPYVSIGGDLLYFGHAHRWALAGELGVMFSGDPKVKLSSSTVGVNPTDIAAEQKKIEDSVKDFKFWPVAKLALNYSF